jgi:hypothetical protein
MSNSMTNTKLNKHHLTWNLVHRLERLGYIVTLDQKAA